jgi:glutaredoxin 3
MFTWEASPSCKQAIEAFETMNANVKIIRLDDPWSEGNPIRAALGRKVGRSSVPCVFLEGKYVGGYDSMVDLAFKGTLRDMLSDAGAMN